MKRYVYKYDKRLLNSLSSSSTGSLGVLTSNTQTPEMSDTTVSSDLLQSFQIVSQLGFDTVGQSVVVLTIVNVSLTVQKPGWDLVLSWVLHDLDNSFQFFLGQLTSSLVQIDISLLTDQVGVTTTNTLNGGQGVNDLDVTINVSVQQTALLLLVTSLLVKIQSRRYLNALIGPHFKFL